ncbi:nitrite reductase (NADH) small subunit [Constrictibacter sp. MBR-5]|jgi:nitrite reductase (NADH) small subunit|uniref:nitrite reductase small subunit NirD n=1 Tax=Constrictibacter sp. MBR-5 TaxID=3156467 RepID=UPI00339A489D
MAVPVNDWIEIGTADDVPALGARVVRAPGGDIAVFKTADGRLFALRDRCPHAGGPLSQGIVHGTSVTCPLHNWIIDLTSGEATGADEGCAGHVPLRLEAGRILLPAALLCGAAA